LKCLTRSLARVTTCCAQLYVAEQGFSRQSHPLPSRCF
jgi:hypothetical protein